jgi:hypothetical protein
VIDPEGDQIAARRAEKNRATQDQPLMMMVKPATKPV